MYLFGGSKSNGSENSKVYSLDIKTMRWEVINTVSIHHPINYREARHLRAEMNIQPYSMIIRWSYMVDLSVVREPALSIDTFLTTTNGSRFKFSVSIIHLQELDIQLYCIKIPCTFSVVKMKKTIN